MARKKVVIIPTVNEETIQAAVPRPRRRRAGPRSVDHVMESRQRVEERDELFDGVAGGDDAADGEATRRFRTINDLGE